MHSDGADLNPLATCTGDLCNQVMAPSWAPDGSRLAYIPRVERGASVVLVTPHGGRTTVRTCSGERCITPDELAWAPDGDALALVAGAGTQRVCLMSVTGADLRPAGRGVRCCLAWLPRRPGQP
jgi:Tol biopolymer transport system component